MEDEGIILIHLTTGIEYEMVLEDVVNQIERIARMLLATKS